MQNNKLQKQKFQTARAQKLILSADLFESKRIDKLANNESSPPNGNLKIFRKNSTSSDSSGKTTENEEDACSVTSSKSPKKRRDKEITKFLSKVLFKDGNLKSVDNRSKEGEAHQPNADTPRADISTSTVSNKIASCVQQQHSSAPTGNHRVFIIKNFAGKSVTLKPKSTPVLLNNINNINKTVVIKTEDNNTTIKQETIGSVATPVLPKQNEDINNCNNKTVIKIERDNDNKILVVKQNDATIKIVKPVAFKQQIQKIPTMKTNKKVMKIQQQKSVIPNFSKILHVLTETDTNTSSAPQTVFTKDIKIPIYVDNQTQTENLTVYKETSVQTEAYAPSPVPSIEEIPNVTDLLQYILNTPVYSSGLGESEKNNLIDMSKNIVMKGKMTNQENQQSEEVLKKRLFLDMKDCVNFDFLGNKPIHNAVLENNLNLLRRQIFALRLRKFSIDIENNQHQTALQLAIINNANIDIISVLLNNGADVRTLDNEGNNLIHLAVMNTTHVVLELLIKYLVNSQKEIDRKNDEGLTPLMLAAIESKPEMVDTLLYHKANPNLRDEKSGRTALFHAVELNCNPVINILLKYKADPRIRNYFGITALDAAKDLEIPEADILDTRKDSPSRETSVIVSNKQTNKRQQQNGDQGGKKSKLSFIPSLKKVEMKSVQHNSQTTSKRKRKKE